MMNILLTIIAAAAATTATHEEAAATSEARTVFMIDPKMRAGDIKQALDLLYKEKNPATISVFTREGKMLTNILEVMPMTNGTLILFKINSPQGIRMEVVSIDSITEISHT